jgi:hypothetical protein
MSRGRRETNEGTERCGGYIRGKDHVGACQEGGEEVLSDHHLRSCVGPEGTEDVVLGAVRQAVKKEVNAQKKEAPRGRGSSRGRFLGGRWMVEREYRNTGSNEGHNEIFVQRIALAEDRKVQEHHREKLAGFGEDESDVVNMGEGGISKRGGQGRGYCDKNQRG